MKKCSKCGADIDDSAITCNICGAPQLVMSIKETESESEDSKNQAQNGMGIGMGMDSYQVGNQMSRAVNSGAVDSFGNPISTGYSKPVQTYSYSPEPVSHTNDGLIKTLITLAIVAIALIVGFSAYKKFMGPSFDKELENYYQALGSLNGREFFKAAFPEEVVDAIDKQFSSPAVRMSKEAAYNYVLKTYLKKIGKLSSEKTTYKDIKTSNRRFVPKKEYKLLENELNVFGTNVKVSKVRVYEVEYKYSTDGINWRDGNDKCCVYEVNGKWYVITGLGVF